MTSPAAAGWRHRVRDVVYRLHAHDGRRWKLRILSYYDAEGGEAAFPVPEYAPVTP